MKRKLDATDDGYFEMPSKIRSSAQGGYYNFQNERTASPLPIGNPMSASTPHSLNSIGGNIRRQGSVLTRINQSPYPQQVMNQSAEAELRHVIDNFVGIYEQLDKNDDIDVKPNYSYTELAYLAMLRSQNFCLPIAQIYSYIQRRFKFFKNSTRKHWKNAVRHSLAKTMCFSKIAVGRGTSNNENLARSTYLWCILPNSISNFARGDYRATVDKETGTNTLRSAYFSMNAGQFWDRIGDYIAHKMVAFRATVETTTNPGAIFESQVCSVPESSKPDVNQVVQNRQAFKSVKNDLISQAFETAHQQTNCSSDQIYNTKQPIKLQDCFPPSQSTNQSCGHQMNNAHVQITHPGPYTHSASPQTQSHVHHHEFDRNNSNDFKQGHWLSKFHLKTPNTSCDEVKSGRSTPALNHSNMKQTFSTPGTPYSQTDSGFETADSISVENSRQFMSSCKIEEDLQRNTASPILGDGPTSGDDLLNNVGDSEQFELPPLCINDLSDFSDTFEENLSRGHFTPQKQLGDTGSFPVPHYIGAPQLISTPISSLTGSYSPMFGCQQAVGRVPNLGYGISSIPVSTVVGYTPDGRAIFAAPSLPQQQWDFGC